MAPNPSAALRVLLAALIAVGTAPVRAFADVPPTKDEPGSSFIVLRVGSVVPTYGSVMIRAAQLKGIKPGEEREVEALFPKQMSNLGRANVFGWSIPYSANHYQVNAQSEKVKVKMSGTASSPRWGLARNGVYLKDGDKEASYQACIPNGDRSCFDAIRGIARRFDVVATPAPAQPAPAPTPTRPAPAPAPNRPAPEPAPVPPAPPVAQAETLKDWKFVRTEDGAVLALGQGTFDGAKSRAASCPGGFVTVPLHKFAFADDKKGAPITAAAEGAGSLKVYKTGPSGQPMAVCPKDKDCAADGVDVRLTACESAASCQGLTINRPDEKRSGTPFVAADLERPFVAKAAGTPVSGKAVVAPTPSEKCSGAASDALAEKLKKLFGDDKAGLTLARVARLVWPKDGETFEAALDKALADPKDGKKAFLEKASAAVLAGSGTAAIAALRADPSLMADFKTHHCGPPAAAPTTADKSQKTKEELEKTAAQGAGRMDQGAKTAAPAVAAAPLPAGNPYEAICRILNDTGNGQSGGGTTTSPPSPTGQPALAADKAPEDKTGDAAKKKKDLQRMVVGGMGGALVLGVFGFIFGGPIGAIAMGAIGFGLMAGVTYLNNNPIDK